jgi:phosphoesterase RecJ-like protein
MQVEVGPAEGGKAWQSNTDVAGVAAWLRDKRRIVVLTHVKPDGDAAGATLAVTRALNLADASKGALGPRAVAWYWGPLPDWMPELIGPTPHRLLSEQERPEHDHREDPDAVLILDTGSWSQLHEVREWLMKRHDLAAVIDHHRQGSPDVSRLRVVVPEAAAACEPAAELCRLILGVSSVKRVPREVAEPLYLGLATDTGWFRHSNVSPSAMRMAADLLEAGVDHASLYEGVEQRDRASRLRLLGRALQSLEYHDGETIAVMTLMLRDFEEARAAATDSAGFSEIPLSVQSVKVSVMITEAFRTEGSGNITKVSFRAKSGPGGVDVGSIAARLGGGGHVPAAGAKLAMPVPEAKKKVLEVLNGPPAAGRR